MCVCCEVCNSGIVVISPCVLTAGIASVCCCVAGALPSRSSGIMSVLGTDVADTSSLRTVIGTLDVPGATPFTTWGSYKTWTGLWTGFWTGLWNACELSFKLVEKQVEMLKTAVV